MAWTNGGCQIFSDECLAAQVAVTAQYTLCEDQLSNGTYFNEMCPSACHQLVADLSGNTCAEEVLAILPYLPGALATLPATVAEKEAALAAWTDAGCPVVDPCPETSDELLASYKTCAEQFDNGTLVTSNSTTCPGECQMFVLTTMKCAMELASDPPENLAGGSDITVDEDDLAATYAQIEAALYDICVFKEYTPCADELPALLAARDKCDEQLLNGTFLVSEFHCPTACQQYAVDLAGSACSEQAMLLMPESNKTEAVLNASAKVAEMEAAFLDFAADFCNPRPPKTPPPPPSPPPPPQRPTPCQDYLPYLNASRVACTAQLNAGDNFLVDPFTCPTACQQYAIDLAGSPCSEMALSVLPEGLNTTETLTEASATVAEMEEEFVTLTSGYCETSCYQDGVFPLATAFPPCVSSILNGSESGCDETLAIINASTCPVLIMVDACLDWLDAFAVLKADCLADSSVYELGEGQEKGCPSSCAALFMSTVDNPCSAPFVNLVMGDEVTAAIQAAEATIETASGMLCEWKETCLHQDWLDFSSYWSQCLHAGDASSVYCAMANDVVMSSECALLEALQPCAAFAPQWVAAAQTCDAALNPPHERLDLITCPSSCLELAIISLDSPCKPEALDIMFPQETDRIKLVKQNLQYVEDTKCSWNECYSGEFLGEVKELVDDCVDSIDGLYSVNPRHLNGTLEEEPCYTLASSALWEEDCPFFEEIDACFASLPTLIRLRDECLVYLEDAEFLNRNPSCPYECETFMEALEVCNENLLLAPAATLTDGLASIQAELAGPRTKIWNVLGTVCSECIQSVPQAVQDLETCLVGVSLATLEDVDLGHNATLAAIWDPDVAEQCSDLYTSLVEEEHPCQGVVPATESVRECLLALPSLVDQAKECRISLYGWAPGDILATTIFDVCPTPCHQLALDAIGHPCTSFATKSGKDALAEVLSVVESANVICESECILAIPKLMEDLDMCLVAVSLAEVEDTVEHNATLAALWDADVAEECTNLWESVVLEPHGCEALALTNETRECLVALPELVEQAKLCTFSLYDWTPGAIATETLFEQCPSACHQLALDAGAHPCFSEAIAASPGLQAITTGLEALTALCETECVLALPQLAADVEKCLFSVSLAEAEAHVEHDTAVTAIWDPAVADECSDLWESVIVEDHECAALALNESTRECLLALPELVEQAKLCTFSLYDWTPGAIATETLYEQCPSACHQLALDAGAHPCFSELVEASPALTKIVTGVEALTALCDSDCVAAIPALVEELETCLLAVSFAEAEEHVAHDPALTHIWDDDVAAECSSLWESVIVEDHECAALALNESTRECLLALPELVEQAKACTLSLYDWTQGSLLTETLLEETCPVTCKELVTSTADHVCFSEALGASAGMTKVTAAIESLTSLCDADLTPYYTCVDTVDDLRKLGEECEQDLQSGSILSSLAGECPTSCYTFAMESFGNPCTQPIVALLDANYSTAYADAEALLSNITSSVCGFVEENSVGCAVALVEEMESDIFACADEFFAEGPYLYNASSTCFAVYDAVLESTCERVQGVAAVVPTQVMTVAFNSTDISFECYEWTRFLPRVSLTCGVSLYGYTLGEACPAECSFAIGYAASNPCTDEEFALLGEDFVQAFDRIEEFAAGSCDVACVENMEVVLTNGAECVDELAAYAAGGDLSAPLGDVLFSDACKGLVATFDNTSCPARPPPLIPTKLDISTDCYGYALSLLEAAYECRASVQSAYAEALYATEGGTCPEGCTDGIALAKAPVCTSQETATLRSFTYLVELAEHLLVKMEALCSSECLTSEAPALVDLASTCYDSLAEPARRSLSHFDAAIDGTLIAEMKESSACAQLYDTLKHSSCYTRESLGGLLPYSWQEALALAFGVEQSCIDWAVALETEMDACEAALPAALETGYGCPAACASSLSMSVEKGEYCSPLDVIQIPDAVIDMTYTLKAEAFQLCASQVAFECFNYSVPAIQSLAEGCAAQLDEHDSPCPEKCVELTTELSTSACIPDALAAVFSPSWLATLELTCAVVNTCDEDVETLKPLLVDCFVERMYLPLGAGYCLASCQQAIDLAQASECPEGVQSLLSRSNALVPDLVDSIYANTRTLTNAQKMARALTFSAALRGYVTLTTAATDTCSADCTSSFSSLTEVCEAEAASGNCEGDCWKAQQGAVDACLEPVDNLNRNLWEDLVGLKTGKFDTSVCKAQCLGTTPTELAEVCDGSVQCSVDCKETIDELLSLYPKKECMLGYLRVGAYGDAVALAIDAALTAGMVYTECAAEVADPAGAECSDACRAVVTSPGHEDDPCLENYFTDDTLAAIQSACVEEITMRNSTRGS